MRELRALLAMPPGLAPAVLDAFWTANREFWVALQRCGGYPLGQAASEIHPDERPGLMRDICQTLGHLHRTGYTHCDIKPENILILPEDAPNRVRILDFGFSIAPLADPDQDLGGTPPYMAPEMLRGWAIDGRADQYSLAVTFSEIFPDLPRQRRWGGLLERMRDPLPGRRYPHILAVRDELTDLFDLPPSPDRYPPFPAGPLRGRHDQLEEVVSQLARKQVARILLQSRRGIGQTRFLLEALLATVSRDGPPLRLVDVASLERPACDPDAFAHYLAECRDAGEVVLCGVPDPSPGLRWLPGLGADGLREILIKNSWERVALPPLGGGPFAEIVADSLGSGGGQTEDLANRLHAQTDADLQLSAEGFRSLVLRCGSEREYQWRVDRERAGGAQAGWLPRPQSLAPPFLPTPLVSALRICARAGRSFPGELALRLLTEFGDPNRFDQLLDHGCLLPDGPDRLAFVTRQLWRQSFARPPKEVEAIDRWIDTHALPDPDRCEDVLFACRRARRLGQRSHEAEYLGKALLQAKEERRGPDTLKLLSYPGEPPETWTEEAASRMVQELSRLLGPSWTEQQVLLAVTDALRDASPRVGVVLTERAGAGEDRAKGAEAILKLLNRAITLPDPDGYVRYLTDLEERERQGSGVAPGVLDFHRALHAFYQGRAEEAETLAERARSHLEGTRLLYEPLTLQLLAVLRFTRDPKAGIQAMQQATGSAVDPEVRAQMQYNLAQMYQRSGNLEESARCADEGIRRLPETVTPVRAYLLRTHRAWTWAEMDRAEPASREAHALLDQAHVWGYVAMRLPLRRLLAFCYLHRGLTRAAITEVTRALEDARRYGPSWQTTSCLRDLVDILLDTDEWETAREHAEGMSKIELGKSDEDQIILARVRALVAQSRGQIDQAAEQLAEAQHLAKGISTRLRVARYFHHRGRVALARDSGAEAAAAFREELGLLSKTGHKYYRGRAWQGISEALRLTGDPEGTVAALDHAIALARDAGCRHLHMQCLKTHIGLEKGGDAS